MCINKNADKFCGCCKLRKGTKFLLFMDFLAVALYVAQIAGVVNGYDNADIYFMYAWLKVPFIGDLYTLILVFSSTIIGFVAIPRIFAYCYMRDSKHDYHRRGGYYCIRILTCVVFSLL